MLSHFSHVQLFAAPWTISRQALLSRGLPRQEYWSGLPFLPPGYLANPDIEPMSLRSSALTTGFFTTSVIWEACDCEHNFLLNVHAESCTTKISFALRTLERHLNTEPVFL